MNDLLLQVEPMIPALRRYARGLVRDAESADDIVQDCLERVVLNWSRRHDDNPRLLPLARSSGTSGIPQFFKRRLPPPANPLVFTRFRASRPGMDEFFQRSGTPARPDMLVVGIRMMFGDLFRIDEFACDDLGDDDDPEGGCRHRPSERWEIVARHGQPLLPPLRRPTLRLRFFFGAFPGLGTFRRSSGSARFAASSMAFHRCWRSPYEA